MVRMLFRKEEHSEAGWEPLVGWFVGRGGSFMRCSGHLSWASGHVLQFLDEKALTYEKELFNPSIPNVATCK